MLDRALRALLEEHQRAQRLRVGGVAAQQMQVERQANGSDARQKPGSEKAHQFLPWRIVRYSRSAPSSGRSVTSRW